MNNNFITNDKNTISLKERLEKLIESSKELKFLVGFFYFSGWKEIYESLKKNPKAQLRILVGLQLAKVLSKMVEIPISDESYSNEQHFKQFFLSLKQGMNNNESDNEETYEQSKYFLELLKQDKLLIRQTREANHSKLYIFKLEQNYQDVFNMEGTFITGSSNLTKAGLVEQNEFNVEIKDYGFKQAEEYFDNLWEDAIKITEKEENKVKICNFFKNQYQNSLVTPFEAYVLILKTYIESNYQTRENHKIEQLLERNHFEKYQYQMDAVNQGLKIIESHNGVIIADVVGLGKSIIASLIANQLKGRGLILCPPGLVGDDNKNTGWHEYKYKFELFHWDIKSIGKIEKIAKSIQTKSNHYDIILVDEAHRFRNEDTSSYEALNYICKGKKVILLTATPFNNSPMDIYSLLKLFITPNNSNLIEGNNLHGFFHSKNYQFHKLLNMIKNHSSSVLDKRKKALKDYQTIFKNDEAKTIEIKKVNDKLKDISKEIKEVIRLVSIRRNRLDLIEDKDYKKEIQNLSVVKDPQEQFYELTQEQDKFYDRVIQTYFSEEGEFKGAIYQPFFYEKKLNHDEEKLGEEENRAYQQQKNLFSFMRRLLVKRFESSFGAFKSSVENFIKTQNIVLNFIEKSGKYILDRKILEKFYDEDEETFSEQAIESVFELFQEKNLKNTKNLPKHAKVYHIDSFERKKEFLQDIKNDIKLLEKVLNLVEYFKLVEEDPKLKEVISKIKESLEKEPNRKILLFSEYKDTIKHLRSSFEEEFENEVLICDGSDFKKPFLNTLLKNFDAKQKDQENRYKILITTDKLSEGFNLNRAGLVINYDIPWNPTRVIQRIGRINRIGKKVFDELYIYNFFPTIKGNDIIKSRTIAQEKMLLIHHALGEDSKVLDITEKPESSFLYQKINKNPNEYDELDLNIKIKNLYKEIEEKYPEIIERITQLPDRVKTAKYYTKEKSHLAILFKKGLALFPIFLCEGQKPKSIFFEDFIKSIECEINEPRVKLDHNFWNLYKKVRDESEKDFSKLKSDLSLEKKAINSLKHLLNKGKEALKEKDLYQFTQDLLEDIKNYHSFSKYTYRSLTFAKTFTVKETNQIIQNINEIKEKLEPNYFEKVKKTRYKKEIIISVYNQNKEESQQSTLSIQ